MEGGKRSFANRRDSEISSIQFRNLSEFTIEMDTLTPKDLSVRRINEMLDRQLKPNSINGKIRTLQQFFKYLYQDGSVATNLAEGLKPIKNDRKMTRTFTEEQVHRILAAPNQNTFTGFTLQYLLGHANLEMTRYYVELFSIDIQRQHEKYSPLENLADEGSFDESEVQ